MPNHHGMCVTSKHRDAYALCKVNHKDSAKTEKHMKRILSALFAPEKNQHRFIKLPEHCSGFEPL